MGMVEYTKWGIKYPWHVTKDMPVPDDCNCEYCQAEREKEFEDSKLAP